MKNKAKADSPLPLRDLPDPARAKPCVLVVDDDDAVVTVIRARLGPDFRVVGVSDPREAIAAALREQPGVVLCDIDMPGMQGDEVAYAFSEDMKTARIPLMYLTSLVEGDQTTPLDGQFGDHPAISKGASPEVLRARVERALGLPFDE